MSIHYIGVPFKLLQEKLKVVKEEMLKIESGIYPVRVALLMFNISRLERFPISAGIPPEIINYNCDKPCIKKIVSIFSHKYMKF